MKLNSTVMGFMIVAVIAIAGDYFLPHTSITQVVGTTTQGGTFDTAKQASVAGVNLAAPGSNATTSSVYNGSSSDRFVTGVVVGCEGVGTSKTAYTGAGLASLTVYAATTSSSNPAIVSNTNKIGGGALTIGTSTTQFVQASSSNPTGNGAIYNIWPAGSYMTFTVNATNTAICTFGVNYTSS